MPLKQYMKDGIPSTYTLEEAEAYEKGLAEDNEPTTTTTPLHIICESIPEDTTPEEEAVILEMIDTLFLYGAGWCLTNKDDETPGCVLLRRGLHGSKYWDSIVDAGVRAELLFRKVDDPNIEFVGEVTQTSKVEPEEREETGETEEGAADSVEDKQGHDEQVEPEGQIEPDAPSDALPDRETDTFLKTKLKYENGALVTSDRGDGVMMQWEDELMKMGRDSLFKSIEDPADVNVLNIGFGMGIIDTLIQEKKPTRHYICEAHPDVLKKMEEDGWMDKENVTVLKGKWQETLPPLLTKGVFFDGIYYDTYSEHYDDMLELYDLLVGLLKLTGTFSFFNGLGADRLVCYEVYKKVVELDLMNYGLSVKYLEKTPPANVLKPDTEEGSVWKDIKRAYWTCPTYYHPEVNFTY